MSISKKDCKNCSLRKICNDSKFGKTECLEARALLRPVVPCEFCKGIDSKIDDASGLKFNSCPECGGVFNYCEHCGRKL